MGIRGDDRARPRSTTREEAELRMDLLQGKITFVTYRKKFKLLKEQGLVQRNGKSIK